MKRALDLAVAVPALLVATPIVAALALAVKISSRGPAFFLQIRIGRGRQPFTLAKLRTMVVGAEQRGAHVTAKSDPRITPLGALLRATKADELPQLLSVLVGDMSLVGPRPEAGRYVAKYRPEWEGVFAVKPGITDLASIVFRNEEELLDRALDRERAYVEAILPIKLRLALEGIERSTLGYEFGILARTIATVCCPASIAKHPALDEARRAIEALNRRVMEAS